MVNKILKLSLAFLCFTCFVFNTLAFAEDDVKKALFIEIVRTHEDNLPSIPTFLSPSPDENNIILDETPKTIFINNETVDDSKKPIDLNRNYLFIKRNSFYIGGRAMLSNFYKYQLVGDLSTPILSTDEKNYEKTDFAILNFVAYKTLSIKVLEFERKNGLVKLLIKIDDKSVWCTLKIDEMCEYKCPFREINIHKCKEKFGVESKTMKVQSKIQIINHGFFLLESETPET